MRASTCQALLALGFRRLDAGGLAAESLQVRTARFIGWEAAAKPRSSCARDPIHTAGGSRRRSSSHSGACWRTTLLTGCGGRLDGPVRPLPCQRDFKSFAVLLVHVVNLNDSTAYI